MPDHLQIPNNCNDFVFFYRAITFFDDYNYCLMVINFKEAKVIHHCFRLSFFAI